MAVYLYTNKRMAGNWIYAVYATRSYVLYNFTLENSKVFLHKNINYIFTLIPSLIQQLITLFAYFIVFCLSDLELPDKKDQPVGVRA